MIWIVIGGFTISYFVLHQDWLSRIYPTPDDWSYVAKLAWHTAKAEEELEQGGGVGLTDWGVVGRRYQNVATICEKGSIFRAYVNPLPNHDEWDRTIPGLDVEDAERDRTIPGLDVEDAEKEPDDTSSPSRKIGYDIESKSDAWRQCYFEALLGVARAAEMMEDWVADTRQELCFPKEQMVGPSNPYPKPIWPGSPSAPREEDCLPVFDTPKVYYTRILTTKGLSRQQKIKAGLAYAAWYDFKGDHSTANALHRWVLKLAVDGLSHPDKSIQPLATTSAFLDKDTGVIPSSAPYTTSNVLIATTALASHIARYGSTRPGTDQSTSAPLRALPIYLSILRARGSAPTSPSDVFGSSPKPDYSLTTMSSITLWLRSLPFRSHMVADSTTGDEPYTRTALSDCEDAALMNFVGEVLYASTLDDSSSAKSSSSKMLDKRRREALGWTRDAVRIAERGATDHRQDEQGRRTCMQCLGAGLENWNKMVGALAKEENTMLKKKQANGGFSEGGQSTWKFWRWGQQEQDLPVKHTAIDPALLIADNSMVQEGITTLSEGEWTKEAAMVQMRLHEFREAKLMEQLNRHIRAKSNWFVI